MPKKECSTCEGEGSIEATGHGAEGDISGLSIVCPDCEGTGYNDPSTKK